MTTTARTRGGGRRRPSTHLSFRVRVVADPEGGSWARHGDVLLRDGHAPERDHREGARVGVGCVDQPDERAHDRDVRARGEALDGLQPLRAREAVAVHAGEDLDGVLHAREVEHERPEPARGASGRRKDRSGDGWPPHWVVTRSAHQFSLLLFSSTPLPSGSYVVSRKRVNCSSVGSASSNTLLWILLSSQSSRPANCSVSFTAYSFRKASRKVLHGTSRSLSPRPARWSG